MQDITGQRWLGTEPKLNKKLATIHEHEDVFRISIVFFINIQRHLRFKTLNTL